LRQRGRTTLLKIYNYAARKIYSNSQLLEAERQDNVTKDIKIMPPENL